MEGLSRCTTAARLDPGRIKRARLNNVDHRLDFTATIIVLLVMKAWILVFLFGQKLQYHKLIYYH